MFEQYENPTKSKTSQDEEVDEGDLLISTFAKVMQEKTRKESKDLSESGEDQPEDQNITSSAKLVAKKARRCNEILENILEVCATRLHSLSRNYIFVLEVLSQEKKLLKVGLNGQI